MERRAYQRTPVAVEAVVACPRFGLIRGTIADIGPDGAYVEVPRPMVPIDVDVTVTFQPEADADSVTLFGHVRHQNDRGFGLVFDAACAEGLAHGGFGEVVRASVGGLTGRQTVLV